MPEDTGTARRSHFDLRTKLLAYSLTLILIPVVAIGVVAYAMAVETVRASVTRTTENTMQLIAQSMDYIFNDVEDVSLFFIRDSNFHTLLTSRLVDVDTLRLSETVRFHEYLWFLFSSKRYIDSVYVQGFNGIIIDPDNIGFNIDPRMSKELLANRGRYVWYPDQTAAKFGRTSHLVFTMARVVNDIDDIRRPLAFLVINVNEAMLSAIYEGKGAATSTDFYLVDSSGTIVSTGDDRKIGSSLVEVTGAPWSKLSQSQFGRFDFMHESSGFTAFAYPLATGQFTLVSVGPTTDLEARGSALISVVLAGMVVSTILSGVFALLFSRRSIRRLATLTRTVQLIGEGDFSIRAEGLGTDEIGSLGTNINRMTETISSLIEQVYVSRIHEKEAELMALQAQVNPHFLYNVLDTIYWRARLEHAPATSTLIYALSDLFRKNLSQEGQLTSLARELDHVKSYMVIQDEKYGGQIRVMYDIETGTEDATVLRLSLQPIVENSIIHGLGEVEYAGLITIRARRSVDELICTIEDNGIGIDLETSEEALRDGVSNHGIGLRNVNERLVRTFGEQYSLRIERREPRGTRVTIRHPFRKAGATT